jgi:DNA-binding CsgD family transcriptional regulator
MKEMQRKKELQHYLLLISLLLFFLMVAGFYVYRQMRKVSKIKKELYETNLKLAELNKNTKHINSQLQKVNAQLSEANHIKEEYIAQFFDICSGYIDKLEEYRKTLYKRAGSHQHEELFRMLKSTTLVDEEQKKLYETFDTIFLNLYPSFVEDFNSLLIREEQVILKPGERLNTELRIFALIRLGITDSIRIAGFLRYSLSTIYNYRTRARNNAVVSRDEFEEMVMNIGAIQEKR